jgi:hypothetical protein
MVLEHDGRTHARYVSTVLKAAAVEFGCDESALQQVAARVPVTVVSQRSSAEGAE